MILRLVLALSISTSLCLQAFAGQEIPWEKLPDDVVARINQQCIASDLGQQAIGAGLAGFSASLAVAGTWLAIPSTHPEAGLPTIGFVAASFVFMGSAVAAGGASMFLAYPGDRSEFLMFLDDLQMDVKSVRYEKFVQLMKDHKIPLSHALPDLNKLLRSEQLCTMQISRQALQNQE